MFSVASNQRMVMWTCSLHAPDFCFLHGREQSHTHQAMFLSSCVFIPPGHTGKPLGCWVSPPSGLCGLTIETPVWSIKANSILTSMFCQCSVQGRRLHLAFNGNEPTILDIAQPESKRAASTSVRNGSLRAILPFRPAFRERDNNTCEIF